MDVLEPERLEFSAIHAIVAYFHTIGWVANGVLPNGAQRLLHRGSEREIEISVRDHDAPPKSQASVVAEANVEPHQFQPSGLKGDVYCLACNLVRDNIRHRLLPLVDHSADQEMKHTEVEDPDARYDDMHNYWVRAFATALKEQGTPPTLSSVSNADMLREIGQLRAMVEAGTLDVQDFYGAVEITLGLRERNEELATLITGVRNGTMPVAALIAYLEH